jgi:nucleoid-associated protein YgaU
MPPSSNGTGPTSTIEISPSDRPRDSLLEHTTPRSTIGTGGGDSSVFGANTLTGGNTYAIQNGDTLSSIAKKNNTTVKALEAANPRIDPNHLKIKQVINLPAPGSSTPASTGTIASTGATTRPSRSSAHSGSTSGAATRPAAAAPGTSYTVKKGDTLRKIAKTVYGDEAQWKQIARANRSELDDPNDLEPGMTLKLPPK